MTDTAPSVGSRNEAAIRARQFYNERNLPQPYYDLLDAALAHERRATVEQIRAAWLEDLTAEGHDSGCAYIRYPGSHIEPPDPCTCGWDILHAILDAAASESEAT